MRRLFIITLLTLVCVGSIKLMETLLPGSEVFLVSFAACVISANIVLILKVYNLK